MTPLLATPKPAIEIPHSRATLPSPEEWAEVTSRLAPGWVADGPCVAKFEVRAGACLGGAGVAVNSGTSALHLALLAVGAGPATQVLIPAYSCAALLNAVHLAGARPVLVDCEAGGFNLCPRDAARRVTPDTAAVVAAHLFGVPADVPGLLQLGLPVVEDCAQSFGAVQEGRPVGGRGRVAIASFYATKVLTTGQGGLVSSAEGELASRVRDMLEYDQREEWQPGFNYRMSDLQAALGLWQLERLPQFLRRRREIAAYYDRELGGVGGQWRRVPSGDDESAIPFRYVLCVPDADAALAALRERGVGAKRPVHAPLHRYVGGDYPQAEAAHGRFVSLPLYPTLTDGEAEQVAAAVRAIRAG